MTENRIEVLRKFFSISVAGFDFVRVLHSQFSKLSYPSTDMETAHRIALVELEKENPNMEMIDYLLSQMEQIAEENKSNNK